MAMPVAIARNVIAAWKSTADWYGEYTLNFYSTLAASSSAVMFKRKNCGPPSCVKSTT
jgi:hypothetical protein